MKQNLNKGPAPKSAIQHFWSADWHRPEGTWISLKHILFDFFRDKDVSQFVF